MSKENITENYQQFGNLASFQPDAASSMRHFSFIEEELYAPNNLNDKEKAFDLLTLGSTVLHLAGAERVLAGINKAFLQNKAELVETGFIGYNRSGSSDARIVDQKNIAVVNTFSLFWQSRPLQYEGKVARNNRLAILVTDAKKLSYAHRFTIENDFVKDPALYIMVKETDENPFIHIASGPLKDKQGDFMPVIAGNTLLAGSIYLEQIHDWIKRQAWSEFMEYEKSGYLQNLRP